jgi:hypothetical protein
MPDTINLLLVGLQTLAALIAAGAAIAMWKSTVNLVKVSRDMLLANIAPEIVIGLESSQPFATKDKANVKVENRGSVDLIDATVSIGCDFVSDDESGKQSEMQEFRIGELKSGYSYKLSLWDASQKAIRKQKSLDDTYQKARNTTNTPVEVQVTSRHGATGIPHTFKHHFLVKFDPTGNLLVSELFIEGDSRRITTRESNTVSEETITPQFKKIETTKTS